MLSKNEILDIRKDFNYLKLEKNFVYFDNGATVQKPNSIIKSIEDYYKFENGNPHRGAHYFAIKATEIYESARERVAKFLNAKSSNEVIFLRNTTEALNLVAYSWALENLKEGDEILLSIMEHHSNCVTWQYVANKTKANLVYLYIDDNKQITDEEFKSKISEKTKLFTITAASNVVGTMPDIKRYIKLAKEKSKNIKTIIDAAQFAPHQKIDVQNIDCDFLAFSGHKMFSAMGIGVLYGKEDILNSMNPFMYGGDMIEYVYEDNSTFLKSPQRFEAGTANVEGAKSLHAAIDYIENIGMENIAEYENSIMKYAYDKMLDIPYIDVYTTRTENRSPVLSFNFKQAHPHDVASILDSYNIGIRSGHHCAQPLHRFLGINFSCRASFSFYNTFEEIDYFIEHLESVRRMMGIES
ncbi:aminotransferase class V-fold PLP-dependent enzyme [Peptoniphilus sp. oral taxon 386]|uniref:aminotransferase class V-fold PLP-dependent enzyme n=1 Tax=Peptoniphilus sp. oral taxon 386 TaxID=652713 RepID=UPI0001DA9CA0|nr:cysteine desulfurase [Peptoniphilus sp. oral taxon 386]EFI42448.1 cysteine desulfurase, SufS subfamily [Peptoniphilus sp. oral taxon 386 str. F0131]